MAESTAVQLRRRRAASHRCPRLACCSCRDPHGCRCHSLKDEANDRYVDGYRDAVQHLLGHGMTPGPNVAALQAMWRRGGTDQRLALRVAESWEISA